MKNFLGILITTFVAVFIAELEDKTQVVAGVGALANRHRIWCIFSGSVVALISVVLLTTFLAGLIPVEVLPIIEFVGGAGLVIFGLYLAYKAKKTKGGKKKKIGSKKKDGWGLFLTQFIIVFLAEMGDKSQIFTAGAAIKNHGNLIAVFLGSASALISVTAITVWGLSFIPKRFIRPVHIIGALGLVVYGVYMMISNY